jgi:3-oxoacyl-[acyl-carrier-protein] synthase-3
LGASITGWGSALPLRTVTNDELGGELGISGDWINDRTGVHSRHIAGAGETTASLASQACAQALKVADVLASEVDMVIVATSTPDYQLPSTASLVQHELGCTHAGGFDLAAACTGFLYGLEQGRALIESGAVDTVVVAGAETLSRVTDYSDAKSCVLFGDGAGAVVLQRSSVVAVHPLRFRSDGGYPEMLYVRPDERLIRMQGREVYRHAVEAMSEVLQELFDSSGITVADVDLIVAHQANGRILEAVADRLGADRSRMAMHIAEVGNTSAASIPLALVDALDNDRLHEGDLVALTAFGAGFTWGAGLLQWGTPRRSETLHARIPALVGTVGHLMEAL